ncbi:MAG: hypothetical protein KC978_04330, partial [Candidatus Omnitrophica bacterium]|nr:hypothetical protein [Candidatus Omnitrophota bacterium]
DGDDHAATQWQVDDHSDFLSPEFDSNPDSANLLSIVVPRQKLRLATFYHWRVRHQDQAGGWSEWSEPKTFTTLSVEGLIVPEDYPTIQAAIDAATDGDTITVTPGDYEEDVRLHGKNVLVTSLDPMDSIIVEQTKIAGTVIFSGTETEECVLQGFTITADSEIAPGIYNRSRLRGCKPTIQFNRIVNNSGSIGDCYGVIRGNLIQFNGSGLVRCGGVIEDNQILGNVDPYGGGLSDCDGTIRRNLIADNFAFGAFGTFPHLELIGRGGAFYECDGLIENNVIVGNEAEEDGSGFYLCDGTIRNNTIVNNPTKKGQSVFYICHANISNNIVYQGENESIADPLVDAQSYVPFLCLIQGFEGEDSTGNFDLPPLFVDESGRDFHLQPHSPCIDHGGGSGVTEDYEGNPREVDGTSLQGKFSQNDVGAYEYQGPYIQAGDLSGNGLLDPLDLFVFQKDWLGVTNASAPANVNWDDRIDSLDLLILMREWLETIPGRPYEK